MPLAIVIVVLVRQRWRRIPIQFCKMVVDQGFPRGPHQRRTHGGGMCLPLVLPLLVQPLRHVLPAATQQQGLLEAVRPATTALLWWTGLC
jgi:hypothetical protein